MVMQSRVAAHDVDDMVVALDDDTSAEVLHIAEDLATTPPRLTDDPAWVAAAHDAWQQLPDRLRRRVSRFRRDSRHQGTLLMRNLPLGRGPLPNTPGIADSVQRTTAIPACVLMMITHGLGDPVAFHAEKGGALVQDVVPVRGNESVQGNSGSVLLSFHIENAFHPHRPDYVLLLCLRPDHHRIAGLRTACIRQTLPLLPENDLQTLFQTRFFTQSPPSFGNQTSVERHAVLSGAPSDPDVRVDFAATRPDDAEAAQALSALGQAFTARTQVLRLHPGDMAIVDNRVTVHGRTAFTPHFDGHDRWLQRTFALADFRRSRHARGQDGNIVAT